MTKAKTAFQHSKRSFSDYKFDTSNYLVIERGVYRDAHTGRLTDKKPAKDHKLKK